MVLTSKKIQINIWNFEHKTTITMKVLSPHCGRLICQRERQREVELRKAALTLQVQGALLLLTTGVQEFFFYESLSSTARQLLGKPSSVASLGLFQRLRLWSESLMIFGGAEKPTSFAYIKDTDIICIKE